MWMHDGKKLPAAAWLWTSVSHHFALCGLHLECFPKAHTLRALSPGWHYCEAVGPSKSGAQEPRFQHHVLPLKWLNSISFKPGGIWLEFFQTVKVTRDQRTWKPCSILEEIKETCQLMAACDLGLNAEPEVRRRHGTLLRQIVIPECRL